MLYLYNLLVFEIYTEHTKRCRYSIVRALDQRTPPSFSLSLLSTNKILRKGYHSRPRSKTFYFFSGEL